MFAAILASLWLAPASAQILSERTCWGSTPELYAAEIEDPAANLSFLSGPKRFSEVCGAGAVVTKDVPDYAMITGNPGRQKGWMSRHGHLLKNSDAQGILLCPESGFRYQETAAGTLRCLDLAEEEILPAALAKGEKTYDEFKNLEPCAA